MYGRIKNASMVFRVSVYNEKCMYQIARINFRFIVNVADDTFSSIKFDQYVYHFRLLGRC